MRNTQTLTHIQTSALSDEHPKSIDAEYPIIIQIVRRLAHANIFRLLGREESSWKTCRKAWNEHESGVRSKRFHLYHCTCLMFYTLWAELQKWIHEVNVRPQTRPHTNVTSHDYSHFTWPLQVLIEFVLKCWLKLLHDTDGIMLSSPQLSKPGMQMTPYQGTSIQRIRASLSYLARRMPRIMAVLQKQFYHRAFSSLSRCKREVGDLVGLRNKTILARSMSESKVIERHGSVCSCLDIWEICPFFLTGLLKRIITE